MISSKLFGTTGSGTPVQVFRLENARHMAVDILDYGAILQRILVPDAAGHPVDVALGYDTPEGYEKGSCYFGAFIGRYAGRIKAGVFELGGRRYQLEKNDGENHLHGTFCRRVFDSAIEDDALVLSYVSPDGEEGYPGRMKICVKYRLGEDNALEMTYTATTDADTVLNLTNHTYFNLNGSGEIGGHRLTLAADSYLESDAETIPTGRILPVDGTPLDFRTEKVIGESLACGDARVTMYQGYDHCYVLGAADGPLRAFATLKGDQSGICMEASTTQPAFQFYTGNFVDTDTAACGKGGTRYPRYGGLCLETQHYPCAPNFPNFPSTVLHPGEIFRAQTVYRFFAEAGK